MGLTTPPPSPFEQCSQKMRIWWRRAPLISRHEMLCHARSFHSLFNHVMPCWRISPRQNKIYVSHHMFGSYYLYNHTIRTIERAFSIHVMFDHISLSFQITVPSPGWPSLSLLCLGLLHRINPLHGSSDSASGAMIVLGNLWQAAILTRLEKTLPWKKWTLFLFLWSTLNPPGD